MIPCSHEASILAFGEASTIIVIDGISKVSSSSRSRIVSIGGSMHTADDYIKASRKVVAARLQYLKMKSHARLPVLQLKLSHEPVVQACLCE